MIAGAHSASQHPNTVSTVMPMTVLRPGYTGMTPR